MSAKNEQTLRRLVSSIRQADRPKTSGYDTQATVRRIEDGVAWVHIPGGVDETPVKLTIAASPGDTVQVRVAGGRAFLVGNASAPPTDDTTAKKAVTQIGAVGKAVKAVRQIAERAAKIAGNTNQYFWHTESGTDTGAHITEIPQEEFLKDPENGGGNLLARSNGIAIRDGLTELAQFAAETVIGNDQGNNSFIRIAPQKISAHKKKGGSYFETGDLNGMVFTETFTGTGTDITFRIKSNVEVGSVDSVTVNGESVGYSWDSHLPRNVTLDSAPASDSEVAITYTIAGDSSYTLNTYFTFGTRDDDYAPGAGSVSFGEDNRLGYGFAYGVGLVGNAGFGPGVSYFGKYNDYSRFYPTGGYDLFVVGNGANDANRSNAFRIDSQGNAFLQGEARSDSYLLPEDEYAPSAVTVRSGEITSLCDITLEANSRYLIVYGAGFATNANGYRKLHLAVNSNTAGRYSPIVRAVDGEQTRMNASQVYTNTSSSSLVLHLWAQQNSGSDLAVYGYAYAIKI